MLHCVYNTVANVCHTKDYSDIDSGNINILLFIDCILQTVVHIHAMSKWCETTMLLVHKHTVECTLKMHDSIVNQSHPGSVIGGSEHHYNTGQYSFNATEVLQI